MYSKRKKETDTVRDQSNPVILSRKIILGDKESKVYPIGQQNIGEPATDLNEQELAFGLLGFCSIRDLKRENIPPALLEEYEKFLNS